MHWERAKEALLASARMNASRGLDEAALRCVAHGLLLLKKAGPEGLGRKNFKIWTQWIKGKYEDWNLIFQTYCNNLDCYWSGFGGIRLQHVKGLDYRSFIRYPKIVPLCYTIGKQPIPLDPQNNLLKTWPLARFDTVQSSGNFTRIVLDITSEHPRFIGVYLLWWPVLSVC